MEIQDEDGQDRLSDCRTGAHSDVKGATVSRSEALSTAAAGSATGPGAPVSSSLTPFRVHLVSILFPLPSPQAGNTRAHWSLAWFLGFTLCVTEALPRGATKVLYAYEHQNNGSSCGIRSTGPSCRLVIRCVRHDMLHWTLADLPLVVDPTRATKRHRT